MINVNIKRLGKIITAFMLAVLPIHSSLADKLTHYEEDLVQSGFYLKPFYNGAYIADNSFSIKDQAKYKVGYIGGGAALGYYYESFRFEIEGHYSKISDTNDIKNKNNIFGSFSHSTAMLNLYSDLGNSASIVPYVGFGAGVARLNFTNDDTHHQLALQGKLGLEFKSGGNVSPYVGYSFLYITPRTWNIFSPNDLFATIGRVIGGKGAVASIQTRPNYQIHNLEVGLIISL